MKKFKLTTTHFMACFVFMTVYAFLPVAKESLAYMPGAGVAGSPHDFSSLSAVKHESASCLPCHVPKEGQEDSSDAKDFPLWNNDSDHKTFRPYSSGSSAAGRTPSELLSTQPGSVSKFCLGCHDGTLGANRYGEAAIRNPKILAPAKIIGAGGDLSNHHPIGFYYNAVIKPGSNIAGPDFPLGSRTIGDLLVDGKMECTTCHSVHNTENTGEKLLWVSDRKSGLCLSCHLL